MSISTLHEQLRALRLGLFTKTLKAQPDTYTEMSVEERLSLPATQELLCRDNTKGLLLARCASQPS